MAQSIHDSPDHKPERETYETEQQLAARLELTPITLQAWRRLGEGPPFVRIGRRAIRYSVRTVDAWIAARAVRGAL